ncbi:hypothetical protein F5050DRAFT_1810659 [Lentinula boryana]|uniref:Uncharacterized protein n=1 Tax=Lentinula boryana TaxID=40481 RepID=A0ABQ8Q532_9AGAR|nr:hypothetical protein F5050DRAFT_1810659 [Lentinula boryana]
MPSLSLSPSQSSLSSATSGSNYAPPSPESDEGAYESMSSIQLSEGKVCAENLTITAKRIPQQKIKKQKSQEEDLWLLTISTHMTELKYTISDIQTRIFDTNPLGTQLEQLTLSTNQSLMTLGEKLEGILKGIKSINDTLDPYLHATLTIPHNGNDAEANETVTILCKHTTLVAEWEAVQDESEVLREELKEDKWLTVFQTVTDQADRMMSSLEKGVNRCQVTEVSECTEFTGDGSRIGDGDSRREAPVPGDTENAWS